MVLATKILIALVALLHIYFLVLEMFLWTKPVGLKAFRLAPEFAEASKDLAANQGLYNGFLSAGLIWSLLHPQQDFAFQLKVFFLACVVFAGVFGALTVSKKIFFIQALPALAALVLVFLTHQF